MIASGAGKNPNNPYDFGWNVDWNANLEPTSAALVAGVQCDAKLQTWTAGNDNLPMNCINWYEAEAFCIWDGGRLPTVRPNGTTRPREEPSSANTRGAMTSLTYADYLDRLTGCDSRGRLSLAGGGW